MLNPPKLIGGRLSYFQNTWRLSKVDARSLETVSTSYYIEFIYIPSCRLVPSSKSNSIFTLKAIVHLLNIRAIELIHIQDCVHGVYSTTLTILKKIGDLRMILDLKFLNKFVKTRPLLMVLIRWLAELQHGEYLTSGALAEAYLQIS